MTMLNPEHDGGSLRRHPLHSCILHHAISCTSIESHQWSLTNRATRREGEGEKEGQTVIPAPPCRALHGYSL